MKAIKLVVVLAVFFVQYSFGQKDTIVLKEVEITSNRISVPFSKNSRTIDVITSEEIIKSSATNISDLLQNFAGIDIRRRGVDGMQSDLYIRGGNFDQTLILIDGVKMDDPQTGHHSMNAIIALSNIERIEILKGPAARIYGQNAFTGAINIVTKKVKQNALSLDVGYGSYENTKGELSLNQKFKNGSLLASIGLQESKGYRYNTDFKNKNIFLKTNLKSYHFTASFTERDFGANGFYASPSYKDQYEETQTSLIAFGNTFRSENVSIKPRVYWRRNQDLYLFLRHNPPAYRNLHISNKAGFETNVVINSALGKTGVGIDLYRVFLVSNNLNDHNRTVITGFLEQRIELENFDITPGLAISSYSDFGTKAFPGIDLGYRFSEKFKIYGNFGYTYRVPTFTDLYYFGPTTKGNAYLEPESALSEEIGFKYNANQLSFDIAFFNRKSDNLIDWTKDSEDAKWEARNFSEVITRGFETNINYIFSVSSKQQQLKLSYNYINDDIKENNAIYTQYSLNSLKHQLSSVFDLKFNQKISQQIAFRYIKRTNGENYNVLDTKLIASLNPKLAISVAFNNIFNTEYTETNLVPMPKGNGMIGVKYAFY
jgi:iron complex outermembrane receptor protein